MKPDSLYLSTIDSQAPDLARQWGLGLEIAEFCTAWNLDDEFPQTDQKVRNSLQGISRAVLHAPYNELFPCAIDRRARALAHDRYLQTIEVAAGYGIRKLVIHPGFDPHLYFPEWFTPQCTLFFRELMKEIPGDVTLCLENVLETDPSLILDIISKVDDERLRMCLDTGHAEAYSEVHPEDWVKACAPYLSHFHIHNNDGRRDLHGPLFEGVIPMDRLLNTIHVLCPKASITLELPQAESSLLWLREQDLLEEST